MSLKWLSLAIMGATLLFFMLMISIGMLQASLQVYNEAIKPSGALESRHNSAELRLDASANHQACFRLEMPGLAWS
ncbi:MAG: hypothetical protein LBV79_00445 [Candidatus Adiutrix sp.]|jgi:hypothetical protein|nr:hypothetical protein [Candidatus Adiutrix sp.]